MKWLINVFQGIGQELNAALAPLKRGETWLTLALIGGFGLITYVISGFAFKTDNVLRYLRYTVGACRELSNGPIIFLFCGMIFFLLTAVLTFGEFQRHFDCKRQAAHYEAKQALIFAICWCVVSFGISTAGLLFFYNYCS